MPGFLLQGVNSAVMTTDNHITAAGLDMTPVTLATSTLDSVPATDNQQQLEDSTRPVSASWYESVTKTISSGIDYAERTVAEYAAVAATQAMSYYNEAQTTLEAVEDSIEKTGVATTFWNYAAPARMAVVQNLVKPIIGERAGLTLERSANAFMNAPKGRGLAAAGETLMHEYAPEIAQAQNAWNNKDNSLGAYYKAFVGGANYLYHYSFDGLADPFGVTKPQLPSMPLLGQEQIEAALPVPADILPDLPEEVMLAVNETQPEDLYNKQTDQQEFFVHDQVQGAQTVEDTGIAYLASAQEFAQDAGILDDDQITAPVISVTNIGETATQQASVPILSSDVGATLATPVAVAVKTIIAAPVGLRSSAQEIARATLASEAKETLTATQQALALAFSLGGVKDLCTSPLDMMFDRTLTNHVGRGLVTIGYNKKSVDIVAAEKLISLSDNTAALVAGDVPQIGLKVFDLSKPSDTSVAFLASMQSTAPAEQSGVPARGSFLMQMIAARSLYGNPAGTNEQAGVAFVCSGLFFASHSKEDNLLRRERDQQILDGKVSRILHTVTGSSSSQSGSDSSHHQENQFQIGATDEIDDVAHPHIQTSTHSDAHTSSTVLVTGDSVVIL